MKKIVVILKARQLRKTKMSDEMKHLIRQNDTIISLLGRLVFPEKELREIITERKQSPENYIKGYNSLNGERSISELTDIFGVTKGTLSPILSEWEEIGIIYEVERPGGKHYRKLYAI